MSKVLSVHGSPGRHWVGNGFPVRQLFSHQTLRDEASPFLLLDYAGPHFFEPAETPRGVGPHPHRGFETVTIVYDGEVAHRDSAGGGGVIRPGDVQWMTAASGILHDEFHSAGFTRTGGPFRMVQLWVNLPARDKTAPPRYQPIEAAEIPSEELPGGAGTLRVIAGERDGVRGPAHTFTPINLWDLRLHADRSVELELPEGHTAMLVVLAGHITVAGTHGAGEAEVVRLDRAGSDVSFESDGESLVLVLTGEPIDEPVVAYGPFVMNSEREIREAIEDLDAGRFGEIPG